MPSTVFVFSFCFSLPPLFLFALFLLVFFFFFPRPTATSHFRLCVLAEIIGGCCCIFFQPGSGEAVPDGRAAAETAGRSTDADGSGAAVVEGRHRRVGGVEAKAEVAARAEMWKGEGGDAEGRGLRFGKPARRARQPDRV